jgi:polysaccharide pyruvyl transferase WcaK-like protein
VTKAAVKHRRALVEWFRTFDVVLDTRAGDSFASIYGMQRLTSMTAATAFAHGAGVPFVLTPQTIGPFQNALSKTIGRHTLRTASLVMARDSESACAAERLGQRADVLTTDVVFALAVPQPAPPRDVVINISGLLRQPSPHVNHVAYRRVVRSIYDRLVHEGRSVSLLAHVMPSDNTDDDVPAVQAFRAEHASEAEVLLPRSLTEVRSILAGAVLVIGSRMHACLNALSVGTPAVPLAYSRKFAPLLSDLGWPHVVDLRCDEEDATNRVAALAMMDLKAEVPEVVERAHSTLATAATALANRVPAGAR